MDSTWPFYFVDHGLESSFVWRSDEGVFEYTLVKQFKGPTRVRQAERLLKRLKEA